MGGLTKANLMKSKSGKIVAKKSSAAQKKRYAGSKAQAWANALKKARKELGCKGFVPFGGKTAAGKALYAKAKAIYTASTLQGLAKAAYGDADEHDGHDHDEEDHEETYVRCTVTRAWRGVVPTRGITVIRAPRATAAAVIPGVRRTPGMPRGRDVPG